MAVLPTRTLATDDKDNDDDVNGEERCVRRFVRHLELISRAAERLCLARYDDILRRVKRVAKKLETKELAYKEKPLSNAKHYQKRANLNDLENRIRNYVAVLPVFGFNSQRYDMNVLKPQLMRILSEPVDGKSSSKPIDCR